MSQITEGVEQRVREEISVEGIRQHLEVFSTLFRDTGSEDERKAAQYIVDTLRDDGIEAEILEFDSLISWPLEGRLVIVDESGQEVEEIPVRTRAFAAQTQPGGIETELIHVPFEQPEAGELIFSHRAAKGDYSGLDVTGNAVLSVDGGPDGVLRAQERGAAAHIHVWPSDEDVIHEMICTSIWGTPTPESAERLPKIPALGVKKADGERLVRALEQGPVRTRLECNVKTEWMRVPLATAFIPGSQSDDFLLVGSHIDSWYEGVTDNATGDVALLEMARVLSTVRDQLRCGVRFGWWPGHSTGRYSGSTWYADHAFMELHEHALGYLNIDSPGVRDTEIWDCRYQVAEVEHVTKAVVQELSGKDPNVRRPLRAGDQSFLGAGLPSLGAFRMLPLDHPDRKAVGGCGGGYWWHSPEDTLDKADPAILASDIEVFVTITLRMCCPEIIPYRFTASAQDFVDRLQSYQNIAGDHLRLDDVIAAAEGFKAAAARLENSSVDDPSVRNEGLLQIARIINPVLYTVNGPYDMDPALQAPMLPGLAQVGDLVVMDPVSDDYRYLLTRLVRERNRVHDALAQASRLAERLTT